MPNLDLYSDILGINDVDECSHLHPATTIAIASGTQLATYVCGLRRLNGEAATSQDAFRLASVSKIYIAALTLVLSDRQLLSLDTPLSNVAGVDIPHVTLADCLGHRTGMDDHFGPDVIENGLLCQPGRRWKGVELLSMALEKPIDITRRGKFHYSDFGFVIAALEIETVTGMPLQDALRHYIFKPLGLYNTWLEPHDPHLLPTINPYAKGKDLTELDLSLDWGGGGLCSTPLDVIRFLRGLVERRLFDDATWARMTEFLETDSESENIQYKGYGLGLGMRQFGKHKLIGHTGILGSFAWWIEGTDIFVAGSTNKLDFRTREATIRAALAAINIYQHD